MILLRAFSLLVFLIVTISETRQNPVKSQQKEKGKQIVGTTRKPFKWYRPPPTEEVYGLPVWELMKYKPIKPNKKFDKLFANNPQIKPLDPAIFVGKPLKLAEEFEKLRLPEISAGPQKPFTSAIKAYLKYKRASQHMQDTVLGHHKRVRGAQVARGVYQRRLQKQDAEKAAKTREADAARKRQKRKQFDDLTLTFSELLAKHDLPDQTMSTLSLAEISKKLLQDIPTEKGGRMLRSYMNDKNYKQSEIEEVMACRTRQCVIQSYANRIERFKRERKVAQHSLSSPSSQALNAQSETPPRLPSSSSSQSQFEIDLDDNEWWKTIFD